MTVEDALHAVDKRGLYVSWLCQGEDDLWQCCLRRKSDQPFSHTRARTVYVRRGKGRTMAEAIMKAIKVDDIEELLG